MRVHLHTNEPAAFRGALEQLATWRASSSTTWSLQQTAAKAATIALVTDSTVDLPEAAQLRLGMVMVPLTVTIGGKTYLDRVELSSPDFYRLLRRPASSPGPPSPTAPISGGSTRPCSRTTKASCRSTCRPRMSGTVQSARRAQPTTWTPRGSGWSTPGISRWGSGWSSRRRERRSRQARLVEEVVAAAEAAARNTRVYGATPVRSIFAVKGGRVNSKVAYMAGLDPAQADHPVRRGRGGHTDGGHLGFNRPSGGWLGGRPSSPVGVEVRLAITHADSPSAVAYLLQQLRKRFGPDQEIPMMECGAVLATHTGLGAMAVAVRRLGRDGGIPA